MPNLKVWIPIWLIAFLGAAFYTYQENKIPEQSKEQALYVADFLNMVSSNWSISTVDYYFHPKVLASDKEDIIEMLQQHSKLGRFIECPKLSLGTFNPEAFDTEPFSHVKGQVVYSSTGNCVFENGTGNIIMGYTMPKKTANQIMVFLIEPV